MKMLGGSKDDRQFNLISGFSFYGTDNNDTALVEIYCLLRLGSIKAENGRGFNLTRVGTKL